MKKDMNLFFADELRKRNLTDEQADRIADVLFSPWDNTPKSISEASLEMAKAYDKWEAEQAKKAKPEEKAKPMTEKELDDLAASII